MTFCVTLNGKRWKFDNLKSIEYSKKCLLSSKYKKIILYTMWQTSCITVMQKNRAKEVRNQDKVVGTNGSRN